MKHSYPHQLKSDEEIWRDFRSGDEQAYAFLYKTYFYRLYNYGRKFSTDADLVEDCIQDLFTKLWRNKENFGDTSSIRNYIFASFRRIVIEKISHRRNLIREDDWQEVYTFEVSWPYEAQLISDQTRTERHAELTKAIQRLTSRQREAIFLKYYEDFSYEEVAAVMSVSVKASYKIMAKALAALRESVKKIYIVFLIFTCSYLF